jgi:hypothetical protein
MKRFVSLMLLFLLMISWSTVAIRRDDPSGNGKIDLEDAIMLMKGFTFSARDPSVFTANAKEVVSTLQVMAGLKTVIKPAKEIESGSAPPPVTPLYVASSWNGSTPPDMVCEVTEPPSYCESIEPEPISPPPRAV